jgi:Family of unknown function (DUF6142)
MTIAPANQPVIPMHRWQGIASSLIGAISIAINLLLVGIVVSGTEPPGPMTTALSVLSVGMLCANLIGIALGVFGATDRSSRKLYPVLGVVLNVVVLTSLVALAVIGLSMNP